MNLSEVRRISALDDELRHRLYLFTRAARRAVSREDAAEHAGISTKLAAFHLDKLVDRGLLKTYFARPGGRSGRGAGRTAKFYEPSDAQIDLSVPPRRYRFVGELLVKALKDQGSEETPQQAADRVADKAGRDLADTFRPTLSGAARLGPERALTAVGKVLQDHGYEPYRPNPREVALKNCPFHELARQAPDLVCRMNHSFLEGLTRGLGNDSVQVLLEPSEVECCVRLRLPEPARRPSRTAKG